LVSGGSGSGVSWRTRGFRCWVLWEGSSLTITSSHSASARGVMTEGRDKRADDVRGAPRVEAVRDHAEQARRSPSSCPAASGLASRRDAGRTGRRRWTCAARRPCAQAAPGTAPPRRRGAAPQARAGAARNGTLLAGKRRAQALSLPCFVIPFAGLKFLYRGRHEHGVYLEAPGRGYVEVAHLMRTEKGNAAGLARPVILGGFRAQEACVPQDLDHGIRRAVA